MLGNIFVIVFATYYTVYIVNLLFSSKKRQNVILSNKKLDQLRKIPCKTLEEQKEFINIRYPKRKKFKFQWNVIPKILFRIAIFIGILYIYRKIFLYFNIELQLWHAMLIIIIGPIVLNLILEKFGIQKASLLVFFK